MYWKWVLKMNIRDLQDEIKVWADSVYPNRNNESIFNKLEEEIGELRDCNHIDPLEYADVILLVLDLASINQIDITYALHKKLAINYERKWEIDEKGAMHHVK
jgi:NTP pyrophosphatase (non-canonical NTP hydrolase)